jgi:hypothetical protein
LKARAGVVASSQLQRNFALATAATRATAPIHWRPEKSGAEVLPGLTEAGSRPCRSPSISRRPGLALAFEMGQCWRAPRVTPHQREAGAQPDRDQAILRGALGQTASSTASNV